MSGIRPLIERQLAITKELHRRELARSCIGRGTFHHFVRHAWPVLYPSKRFVDGRVVHVTCEALEAVWWGSITRLMVNLPPRTLKSTLLNVLYPAWCWIQDPGHQFMTLSASENIAIRDALSTRILLQSTWYQAHWGDKFELRKDQAAKDRYANSQGGYRLAFPIGARLTGEGADTITIDDPHDAKEVRSDLKRVAVIEDYQTKIDSRLNDRERGKIILIAQRLHEGDLSGHILDNIADVPFETIILPMEYDGPRYVSTIGLDDWRTKPGELLFPERFSSKSVDQWKAILKHNAAGQLQQSPTHGEGGILPRSKWRVWGRMELPPMHGILLSLDTSMKSREDNDASAFGAFGLFEFEETNPDSLVYGQTRIGVMLTKAWNKHVRFSQLKELVHKEYKLHTVGGEPPDELVIEDTARGPMLIEELDAIGVPAFAYNPGRLEMGQGDAKKVTRAKLAAEAWDEGLVWIPGKPLVNTDRRATDLLPDWAEEVVDQCEKFPLAEHDDLVDMVVQAIRRLRQRGELEWATDVQPPEDEGEDDWPGEDGDRFVNPYS